MEYAFFGGAGSDEEEESDAGEDGEVQGGMLDDTAAQPQAVTLTAAKGTCSVQADASFSETHCGPLCDL